MHKIQVHFSTGLRLEIPQQLTKSHARLVMDDLHPLYGPNMDERYNSASLSLFSSSNQQSLAKSGSYV